MTLDKSTETKISKNMTYLLRHKAVKEGILIDKFGFIWLDDLIGWLKTNLNKIQDQITPETIQEVVDKDSKTRFTLTEENGRKKIRANQGHSMEIKELELKEITLGNSNSYGLIVHGSFDKNRELIQQTGLKKMSRTHVHMVDVIGDHSDNLLRSNANMYVVVDMVHALKDGLKFYESINHVVLCDTDIPAKYLTLLDKAPSNYGTT